MFLTCASGSRGGLCGGRLGELPAVIVLVFVPDAVVVAVSLSVLDIALDPVNPVNVVGGEVGVKILVVRVWVVGVSLEDPEL